MPALPALPALPRRLTSRRPAPAARLPSSPAPAPACGPPNDQAGPPANPARACALRPHPTPQVYVSWGHFTMFGMQYSPLHPL